MDLELLINNDEDPYETRCLGCNKGIYYESDQFGFVSIMCNIQHKYSNSNKSGNSSHVLCKECANEIMGIEDDDDD